MYVAKFNFLQLTCATSCSIHFSLSVHVAKFPCLASVYFIFMYTFFAVLSSGDNAVISLFIATATGAQSGSATSYWGGARLKITLWYSCRGFP